MRQKLNPRKTARYAAETGLPVVAVLVRGDTDHRKDLLLTDGTVVHLYKDGTREVSPLKWNQNLTILESTT